MCVYVLLYLLFVIQNRDENGKTRRELACVLFNSFDCEHF